MYKIDELKELIQAFKEGGLTELDLKDRDFEITLKKEIQIANTSQIQMAPVITQQPQIVAQPVEETQIEVETKEIEKEEISGNIITSPIVGTFYAAANPESENFAVLGQKVKKGDILCIVEAMKLMNEIESEYDGEIVEILVQNEEMVEFGQPLDRKSVV